MIEAQNPRLSPALMARACFLAAIPLVVLAIAWKLGVSFPTASRAADGGNPLPNASQPVGRSEVRAQARLEPESGLIVVGVRPGLRIEQILVAEGDHVVANAPLAILEGHAQRQLQFQLALAQKTSADFRRQLRRDELKLERDRFDRLKATRLKGLQTLVAFLKDKLADPKSKNSTEPATALIPGQAVARELAAAQASIGLAKAEVELKELETSLELLNAQRGLEDKLVNDTTPESDVLDRQVELAKSGLEDSEVRAPISGRVLGLVARAGEISSGALLYLGDVKTMAARAEVFETDALDVEVGASASVVILGKPVSGKVVHVGTLVGRNRINSLDPTALADRRVVEVLIRLDDGTTASRLMNMQVEAAIRRSAKGAGAR